MKKSFYQFMMTYRGKLTPDDEDALAEWMFNDHSFPKHTEKYNELSQYLEMNSPFLGALSVFDRLYEIYLIKNE